MGQESQVIRVLYDFPPCPECDMPLTLRDMPDLGEKHWHCECCGTEWEVMELIEALNQVQALAFALAMEEEDEQV